MKKEFPLELADLCVKCGLCTPHCPTYELSQMEPESPRGRLSIMSAIASAQIPNSPKAQEHLDNCLGCQACEAVCPAKVPYLDLLDSHRQLHAPQLRLRSRLSSQLALHTYVRPLLRAALLVLQRIRPAIQALLPQHSKAAYLLSLAPSKVAWRQPASQSTPDAQVLLGCMGDMANAQAIKALQTCASALGLRLSYLPATQCCSALPEHHGQTHLAERQRAKLTAKRAEPLPLLVLDSACTNQLRRHDFSQVFEICDFLLQQDWSALKIRPLNAKVLIHTPCSHKNGLKETYSVTTLLGKIPGLELQAMSDPFCCGAAGTHMLDQPERAQALLRPKLKEAQTTEADYIVTSNVGCALHFAAGLRRQGLQDGGRMRTVIHPLELLAQQIDA